MNARPGSNGDNEKEISKLIKYELSSPSRGPFDVIWEREKTDIIGRRHDDE